MVKLGSKMFFYIYCVWNDEYNTDRDVAKWLYGLVTGLELSGKSETRNYRIVHKLYCCLPYTLTKDRQPLKRRHAL